MYKEGIKEKLKGFDILDKNEILFCLKDEELLEYISEENESHDFRRHMEQLANLNEIDLKEIFANPKILNLYNCFDVGNLLGLITQDDIRFSVVMNYINHMGDLLDDINANQLTEFCCFAFDKEKANFIKNEILRYYKDVDIIEKTFNNALQNKNENIKDLIENSNDSNFYTFSKLDYKSRQRVIQEGNMFEGMSLNTFIYNILPTMDESFLFDMIHSQNNIQKEIYMFVLLTSSKESFKSVLSKETVQIKDYITYLTPAMMANVRILNKKMDPDVVEELLFENLELLTADVYYFLNQLEDGRYMELKEKYIYDPSNPLIKRMSLLYRLDQDSKQKYIGYITNQDVSIKEKIAAVTLFAEDDILRQQYIEEVSGDKENEDLRLALIRSIKEDNLKILYLKQLIEAEADQHTVWNIYRTLDKTSSLMENVNLVENIIPTLALKDFAAIEFLDYDFKIYLLQQNKMLTKEEKVIVLNNFYKEEDKNKRDEVSSDLGIYDEVIESKKRNELEEEQVKVDNFGSEFETVADFLARIQETDAEELEEFYSKIHIVCLDPDSDYAAQLELLKKTPCKRMIASLDMMKLPENMQDLNIDSKTNISFLDEEFRVNRLGGYSIQTMYDAKYCINNILMEANRTEKLSDKFKTIYFLLALNIDYDFRGIFEGEAIYKNNVGDISGFTDNALICRGYASILDYICKQAGIEAPYVSGEVLDALTGEWQGGLRGIK